MDMSNFSREVRTVWQGDGRSMMLLDTLVFIDSNGRTWTAPETSIVDGASIPRFFWRLIGSPFVGKYRRASVVHDVYCKQQTRPYKQVHKMFHDAMLCDGVSKSKAWVMYQAVKHFGPKW
jgi:hypothetical protein